MLVLVEISAQSIVWNIDQNHYWLVYEILLELGEKVKRSDIEELYFTTLLDTKDSLIKEYYKRR